MQCGIFKAISKKHFRSSRSVKRIIAIEAQLYFLGLVGQYSDFITCIELLPCISFFHMALKRLPYWTTRKQV